MKFLTLTVILFTTQWVSAKNLFRSIDMVNHLQLEQTERSAMLVKVNHEMLLNKTSQFDIQLPNGINTSVVFEKLKFHNKNRFSWQGHLKGQPQEQLIISSVNGYYAGSLYTKSGVFEFTSPARNTMRIAELALEEFPGCAGDDSAPTSTHADSDLPVQLGGTVEFDVMVLYTPQARDAAGGVSAIEATAQAAVDAMNLSFTNSGVDAEGTMTYTGLIDYDDTGDSSADLSWVRSDSTVATLRTAYGADMVSLLVNSMSGCGRGYVMRSPGPGFSGSAFQVTKRSCAVGNLSFAHEFGHNMGLEHNPEDSSVGGTPASASYPWSFGHYHNGSYRTVMSYSAQCASGCTRRQYFSNPDVQFNGLDSGIDGSRDNARSLDLTAPIIAAFRSPANDTIFEDGFE